MSKDTDMVTEQSKVSLTVMHTGKVDDQGKELVLTCGYAKNGHFGYFICKEHMTDKGTPKELIHYSDQLVFMQKQNEKTLREATELLKVVASTM